MWQENCTIESKSSECSSVSGLFTDDGIKIIKTNTTAINTGLNMEISTGRMDMENIGGTNQADDHQNNCVPPTASKYTIYDLKAGLIEKTDPIYENLKPDLLSGQNMLLRKLFGTIEKPDAIYENLCRGCGYGVFEAKSYLCNFCSCVVGGLKNSQLQHLEESNQININTGENIYENVCVKCSALYNTEECEFCSTSVNITEPNIYEKSQSPVATSKKQQLSKKVRESKSFNKFDKQKLINGIFGSLRRGVKTKQTNSNGQERASKKLSQLHIIHHVDGYDNIFRTNETFDLQRICEMKQAQSRYPNVSASDQHIYGRLKFSESFDSNITTDTLLMSKSQELLQVSKIDSICNASTNEGRHTASSNGKPTYSSRNQLHISKPRPSGFKPDKHFNATDNIKLALPLSNSICYWMKLLRKQIHNYLSHDDENYASCIPKSIPSKNILMHTYCAASSSNTRNNCSPMAFPSYLAETMTNFPVTDKEGEFNCTTLTNTTNSHSNSNSNISVEQMESCFDVMVDVFKQNVMTKHLLYHQRESQPSVDHSNSLSAMPKPPNHLTRSLQQQAKEQTKCMNNDNNALLDCPAEHSSISVILNAPQALSIVASENCLASCCSACNVTEVSVNICGCLNVGNDIGPRVADSEFQHQTVASVGKYQNKEIKTIAKTLIKTETADAFNSAVASGVHEEHAKQINCFNNVTDSIENNSYVQNKVYSKLNLVHLVNGVSISYSLNTNVLHSCSNRTQYFNWLQDWLLCYYNPWSLNVKRALKVLANSDSFEILAFKLWSVLYESVTRHKTMWDDDKQGARVCIGETAISSGPNEPVVMKYGRMALRSELENVAVFDEKESEKLIVSKSVDTHNSPMKTNDEVVLRTKGKESLERRKKAHGKVLDLDKNVADLNETDLKLSSVDYFENIEIDLGSTNDLKLSQTKAPLTSLVSSERNSPKSSKEHHCPQQTEEDIYQPIWKFQTVGEAQETYDSDPEYYDAINRPASLLDKQQLKSDDSTVTSRLISDNVEDHGEWETDDEFMFSKSSEACCIAEDTISSQTSHSNASQCSSSTKISFESSTSNIASATTLNLVHPLLRTVCIFFSLTEPKIRAIVYDYKRAQASQYFSKGSHLHSLKWANTKLATIPPINVNWKSSSNDRAMARTSISRKNASNPSTTLITSESGKALPAFNFKPVQAWKLNLLNAAYVEDEEDLIVSETEILRSQIFKEETENQTSPPKSGTLQRFKSASFDTLLDIPTEDDKKSITERMRNKLQRGVFKLNMLSPKSEKKRNGIFRPVKTGSLYLEEGIQPKFPIFGASLEELEMHESLHENVPRFVVDCVSYIERQDCILQDGLYRASGNKVAIDELKKRLSESYIYDPKLLVADDIHTITSLLKQFFRELSKPLIPQDIYDQIGRNVSDAAGIEMLRDVLEAIPDPNRSTLKFLTRHLKHVAAFSMENRMPAKNLAIVWGPCIFSSNQMIFVDIGRMNTLTKLLIENYEYIFRENERLIN